MAKTPAERQRDYMLRKDEKEKQASLTLAGVFKKPFFETLPEDFSDSSDFADNFDFVGIVTPEFADDRGIEFFTHYSPDSDFIERGMGSLGRAETMVSGLIEAAAALAVEVNSYKRAEIKARIAEIEASDLTDPAKRKAALQDATRLNKMLDQLDKQVRWTFRQWKVTG